MEDLSMTEADEMFESIEQDVKDLLKHYENLETYTDCEEYRKQGAISALEKLLAMWNE
jgi:hypothetical protein